MTQSFYDFSLEDLQALFAQKGLSPAAPGILFNWHYKKKEIRPCEKDIPKQTLGYIKESLKFSLPDISLIRESADGAVKFLFGLEDGFTVESVLLPFQGKYSLCLSSQVGCAMKCSFCHTGMQGFKRHLRTSEIVGQYLGAWRWLADNRPGEARVTNIVFMGQGEPLANFDAVKKSCEIFLSQHGASIGAQKITVSTAGYLPGLNRWAREMPGVNLALSLHSAYADKRSRLIPINRRWPLEEVLDRIDQVPLARKQFVTYEYLLIKDFNDGREDARAVGELLKGKRALVNLIPFNPVPGSRFQRPETRKVETFKQELEAWAMPVMIRGTKGDDVMAACGQLNTASGS